MIPLRIKSDKGYHFRIHFDRHYVVLKGLSVVREDGFVLLYLCQLFCYHDFSRAIQLQSFDEILSIFKQWVEGTICLGTLLST